MPDECLNDPRNGPIANTVSAMQNEALDDATLDGRREGPRARTCRAVVTAPKKQSGLYKGSPIKRLDARRLQRYESKQTIHLTPPRSEAEAARGGAKRILRETGKNEAAEGGGRGDGRVGGGGTRGL
jgi:hypothetical protein